MLPSSGVVALSVTKLESTTSNEPEMLTPINNPSELWFKRDVKNDMGFRPLEPALLAGKVDAIYTQSKVFQHLQEATGKIKMNEDLSKYPDWSVQIANTPAVITCTDVMADEHPELVMAYMKAMVKVGRWANENKHAAGAPNAPLSGDVVRSGRNEHADALFAHVQT